LRVLSPPISVTERQKGKGGKKKSDFFSFLFIFNPGPGQAYNMLKSPLEHILAAINCLLGGAKKWIWASILGRMMQRLQRDIQLN